MRKLLLRALVPPLVAGLLLAGVIALGEAARASLRQQERYTLSFGEIDCAPPPPGEGRTAFLNEVQYLGELPERLPLLDDDLPGRLAATFARHPWVEKVARVEVEPQRQVRVWLVYRTPVLVVLSPPSGFFTQMTREERHRERKAWASESWVSHVVDGHGVLLPVRSDSCFDLPRLKDEDIPPPAGGTQWGDPRLDKAARTAAYLRPCRDWLKVESLELTDTDLILAHSTAFTVLWGHAPGEEPDDEAPAAQKVERLLASCQEHGGLGKPAPQEYDVRPRARATHRPLP